MSIKQMRTWAEVSEAALVTNINVIKRYAAKKSNADTSSSAAFLGVVKADAYGHGAPWAARILEREGARYLAVAMLSEALELRETGVTAPILILGVTPPERLFVSDLLYYDLTQTVADHDTALAYSVIARSYGKNLKCHLKLDTGMGRLGFTEEQNAVSALRLPNLYFEGVFTHFAVSDVPDGGDYTRHQFERFAARVGELERAQRRPFALRHCANTGGTMDYASTRLDMVRPGIMLYGYPRSAEGLQPVMELKSRIAQIKTLKAGESVSYGRRFTAERETRIAIMPCGYADGLSRALTNKLTVRINGQTVHQIGTICMDMCMLDVTDAPDVKVGDVATIFGREHGFTAEDIADTRGSISYEVLCNVAHRVPRVYV